MTPPTLTPAAARRRLEGSLMRIGPCLLALVAALGLGGAAWAQAAPAPSPAPERLVVGKPSAEAPWKTLANASTADHWLWEQVPADQTADSHSEMLVAQGFASLAGADPADFLRGMAELARKDCNAVRVNGPAPRIEDGHHVAYGQIYCGRRKGQTYGLSMFYKVIVGADALYVVEREVTTPGADRPGVMSFDKAHADQGLALLRRQSAAILFLDNAVYLCDPASTDSRCQPLPP